MAFEGLTDKLQGAFKKLNSKGKLNEADVKAAMRDVRMALLEADVNFLVVKDFVKKVTERAVGQDIMQSLTPGQQVIKIVNEELTNLMGGTNARLTYSPQAPTIYMMVGLQGAGKTTMCAKLGNMLKKDNKKPLLVACDVYRPAAIKQLQVPATCTVPPPSSNCRWLAARWTWKCSSAARATPLKLRRKPWTTRNITAATR